MNEVSKIGEFSKRNEKLPGEEGVYETYEESFQLTINNKNTSKLSFPIYMILKLKYCFHMLRTAKYENTITFLHLIEIEYSLLI